MPCHNCSVEFGMLKKEIGCDACGFSFCSRCCKRYEIAGKDEKCKKQLCSKCFNKIMCINSKDAPGSPPLAHKKRMEMMKKKSVSVDSASKVYSKLSWENKEDQALAERLQRLKDDRLKKLPSDDEIAERIARLKGLNPAVYKAPPIEVFVPTTKRHCFEQVDDLIKQVKEEADIDARILKPEDEIALRLAALRDEKPKMVEEDVNPSIFIKDDREVDMASLHSTLQDTTNHLSKIAFEDMESLKKNPNYKKCKSAVSPEKISDSSDDEQEAEKLMEKLLSCNIGDDVEELDSIMELDSEMSIETKENTSQIEDFPWCVICTENAKVRCFGCDGDLYCQRCFKECHDSLENHKTCPYLNSN